MSRIHWRAPTLALALAATAALFLSCGKLHTSAVTAPVSRTAPLARASGSGSTRFSGQATAVRANVLGINTVLSDAGPLPPSGGAEEKSLLTANVPGVLTVNVLHATT